MEYTIMGITIDSRSHHAPEVQEVLTRYGCIIRTRLGLHETAKETCSERGLILLEIPGESNDVNNLVHDLQDIEGVRVNTMKV